MGIPPRTFRRYCKSGKVPAILQEKGGKSQYLILSDTVELLLQQGEAKQKLDERSKGPKPHQSYLKPWLASLKSGTFNGKSFSPRTIQDYRAYSSKFLDSYDSLTTDTLKHCLSKIPAEQYSKRDKIYKMCICLGKFLISKKELDPAFLIEIKTFRPKRHLPPKRITVSEQELRALYNAAEGLLQEALVVLLSSAGLRASEASDLRLSDVDLEEGILTVECGKGGKRRRVGLSPKCVELLYRYIELERPKSSLSSLFLDPYKRPFNRNTLYNEIRKLSRKTGIHVSPHALRRAFVTINANKGRPLQMLQMACGHSDITTTRNYCMTSEQEVIDAMKDWN